LQPAESGTPGAKIVRNAINKDDMVDSMEYNLSIWRLDSELQSQMFAGRLFYMTGAQYEKEGAS